MKILIYGAGVIGSLYAFLLKKSDFDVTIYARGNRFEVLKEQGLLYRDKEKTQKLEIKVIAQMKANDKYDFIF